MAEKIHFDDIDSMPSNISDEELDAAFAALLAKAKAKSQPEVENPNKPKFVPQQITADQVTAITDSQEAMNRSMTEWQQILAPECGVFNTKYGYLAKKYDSVIYEYIGNDDNDAASYARHNLVAILRYKYFKVLNDESQERIDKIVSWFCKNIYNNICYLTVNADDPIRNSMRLDTLPSSAVAFANGVYDFKENRFIMKYERIKIPSISNTMILYRKYIIMWCFNYDFEPLDINIMNTSFKSFIDMLRNEKQDKSNLTWQLFSNMAHDAMHNLTDRRLVHLSEILGYTIMTPLVQSFVMLIGAGQNGKNSIYDGAFSHFVIPAPGQESLDNIEEDKFIGGTLRGLSHNICLETVPGVKKTSDQLKKLTGSGEFAIEEKGKTKTTIPMNCKFIFSGNDQNNIKFSDKSHGFDRRCNLFEIYYTWDRQHTFMNYNPDYYPCDFSIQDITSYTNNNRLFVYLGMYGIMSATNKFTQDFNFTYNEWSELYSDTNVELVDFFTTEFTPEMLFRYWDDERLELSESNQKLAFYIEVPVTESSTGAARLSAASIVKNQYEYNSWHELAKLFKTYDEIIDYDQDGNEIRAKEMIGCQFFADNDLYVSIEYLRSITKLSRPMAVRNSIAFSDEFRKSMNLKSCKRLAANKTYVRARLVGGRVKFLNEL